MWHYQSNYRGNQRYQGLAPMEQNHSSVKAYLGKGGTLSFFENVRKLFKRHLQHSKERCRMADNLLVCLIRYVETKHVGILNIMDNDAKKSISSCIYHSQQRGTNVYTFIQSTEVKDGTII